MTVHTHTQAVGKSLSLHTQFSKPLLLLALFSTSDAALSTNSLANSGFAYGFTTVLKIKDFSWTLILIPTAHTEQRTQENNELNV